MKFIRTNAILATLLAVTMCTSTLATSVSVTETSAEVPELINPVTSDKHGHVEMENDDLLDFIIPEYIDDTLVESIGPKAFQGCDLFRTVTIPASVTHIGTSAFADCPYLEAIILADRSDTSGMALGYNWNGDASIVFEIAAPSGPSDELLSFEKALSKAQAFDTVDASNLEDAKASLEDLYDTYWDLTDEECTKDLINAFEETYDALSQLIIYAEAPSQDPVEAPDGYTETPIEGQEPSRPDENTPVTGEEPSVTPEPGSESNPPEEPVQPDVTPVEPAESQPSEPEVSDEPSAPSEPAPVAPSEEPSAEPSTASETETPEAVSEPGAVKFPAAEQPTSFFAPLDEQPSLEPDTQTGGLLTSDPVSLEPSDVPSDTPSGLLAPVQQ